MSEAGQKGDWRCRRCDQSLVLAKVQIRYMGSVFTIDLPKCPKCGTAIVTEETALGKMAEAEQLLEDK